MQGSSVDQVSSSTTRVEPQSSSNTTSTLWCSNASTIASAGRSHFAPLTAEEKITYRNWRRGTLAFYAVFACMIAAILIAIGPVSQSSTVQNGDLHSALASAAQRNSH
jgi:hypothetical protein